MNANPACGKVREALEEAAGQLRTGPESGPLREHLAGCPECRRFAAEHEALLAILLRDRMPDPGPAVWNRLSTRIMAEVRRQGPRPAPWHKRAWLNPFGWPVYAWSPLLALLVAAALLVQYAPFDRPLPIAGRSPLADAVSLEEVLDPLQDPVYTLTPRETARLKQKVVAGLARDLKTDSPVEAVLDWDLNNRFETLTNAELEQIAKKLQTVGPAGTGEVRPNVS
jgi:hypothetical protein